MPHRLVIADATVKAHAAGLRWIFSGLGIAITADIAKIVPWLQAASLMAGTVASMYGLYVMYQHRKAELEKRHRREHSTHGSRLGH